MTVKCWCTADEKQKESSEMPVVCILFNGYHDALKMVVFALDEKIPVLVVKVHTLFQVQSFG